MVEDVSFKLVANAKDSVMSSNISANCNAHEKGKKMVRSNIMYLNIWRVELTGVALQVLWHAHDRPCMQV